MIKDIGKYVDRCDLYQRIIKCSSYLIIQDLVRYFKSPNILCYNLGKCGQTFRVRVRTLVIIISLWLERNTGTGLRSHMTLRHRPGVV